MKNAYSPLASLSVAIALAFGASAAQAQQVTIKFSHFLASNSNFHKGLAEPWCAAIEQDSGGKMKCQLYPALQFGGTPPQLADQAKNGVADVVWTSPSYSTGRFPRTEALELPFTLPPGGVTGARAMWDHTQKHGMEDYKDFKLMGGTPVNMPVAAVTGGISKGVIDGAMAPWEILPAVKIDEVTKYHIEGPANLAGFSQTPFTILINKRKYESLTPELKAVIDKHSGLSLSEQAGKVWDDGNAEAHKKLVTQGNTLGLVHWMG